MLRELFFLQYGYGAQYMLRQSLDEGKDAERYREQVEAIDRLPLSDPARVRLMYAFWDALDALPAPPNPEEPATLADIWAKRPPRAVLQALRPDRDAALDRLHGAWLGRIAGCMFGKPVEGFGQARIAELLKSTGNYPMRDYLRAGGKAKCEKLGINSTAMVELAGCAMPDDDTNYTVLGLTILEKYGPNFTTDDVGEAWLQTLPAVSCCTAEFAAYRNLLNKVFPPRSATYRNPFREWIGAQIRADVYGYVTPFSPQRGAELAYRDASLSHTANGVYGSMYVAALLSLAWGELPMRRLVERALCEIPEKCRLRDRILRFLRDYDAGLTYETFSANLLREYAEHDLSDAVHTIPNALIVTACLLYGEGDFAASVGSAVMCGFDTDCNAATVGSVFGLRYGEKGIPPRIAAALNDTLETDIRGSYRVSVRALAERTADLLRQFSKEEACGK